MTGDLDALGIGVIAEFLQRRLEVRIAMRPFAAVAPVAVEAGIGELDPRAFDAAWPTALLDARLHGLVEHDGAVSGRLQVSNRIPGRLADRRIPFRALRSEVSASGGRWTLAGLVIDAGLAGRLVREATLEAAGLDVSLLAQRVDLGALHAPLHATALHGPLRLAWDGARARFDADLAQVGSALMLSGVFEDGHVRIERFLLGAAAGRIEASGAINLAAPQQFEARGRIVDLDPARLGRYPVGRINAGVSAVGRMQPALAQLAVTISSSRLHGRPLSGSARLFVDVERVRDIALELRLADAVVRAAGAFGATGERLVWELAVPDMAVLHPDTGGSIRASGTLAGTWTLPGLTFDLEGTRLRAGSTLRLDRLHGVGRLEEGASGRMQGFLQADVLQQRDTRWDRLRVDVEGTRARHEAGLEMGMQRRRAAARFVGGLDDVLDWRGALQSLQVQGDLTARLEQPISLSAGRSHLQVGPGALQLGAGRIELFHLDWSVRRGFDTAGAATGISLAELGPWLPLPSTLRELVVGVDWEIAMGETFAGRIGLRRERGEVILPSSPGVAAGLGAVSFDARASGGQIVFRGQAESAVFGTLTASGSTRAQRRAGRWGVAGDAPLQAQVEARTPSLEWTRALLPEGITLGGSAALRLGVSGTIAEPVYVGSIQGQGLSARLPEQGVVLTGGVLEAVVEQQRLVLRTLRFDSASGRVTGTGTASLAAGRLGARVDLEARQLSVMARPDRLAVVGGNVSFGWDSRQLRAEGRLVADRERIEQPREDTPRPSQDVRVLGRKPPATREIDVVADVHLDLGRDFSMHGRGLATRLGGTLRAQFAPGSGLALTGMVRTADGTYTAYGQKLDIQRGVLTFAGPADNPSLDVLAVRKAAAVEVGVAIGGTAMHPRVRLVSTPPMSDADKLAWLTLGRGLDSAGRNESAVLQVAALALLWRGVGDGGATLASRFGVDELSLATVDATGEQVVSIGKRFASNFYVGFERGIAGAVNVVKITYDLSRRWSVQAWTGSENAVDLFYTLGFR